MRKVMDFVKRPFIGDDTTGRLAYKKQWGYTFASLLGNGGWAPQRSLAATTPMNITVGPTHRVIDPTQTGVVPGNFDIEPLSTIQGATPQI